MKIITRPFLDPRSALRPTLQILSGTAPVKDPATKTLHKALLKYRSQFAHHDTQPSSEEDKSHAGQQKGKM